MILLTAVLQRSETGKTMMKEVRIVVSFGVRNDQSEVPGGFLSVGYNLFLDLSGGHVGVLTLHKIIWLNLSVNIILQ